MKRYENGNDEEQGHCVATSAWACVRHVVYSILNYYSNAHFYCTSNIRKRDIANMPF